MKTRLSMLLPLAIAAGCVCPFARNYPSTIDEGFTEEADVSALEAVVSQGVNFVARFEFLPKEGADESMILPMLRDNVGKQLGWKESNFAGNGSYVRKAGMWNFEEVRVIGGELEVMLNGYIVTRAKKGEYVPGKSRWIGFTGNEEVRRLRIKKLPASATMDGVCPKSRMKCPEGFTPCFNGNKEDLAKYWKGVTTDEGFDNPKVRHAASEAKRIEKQALADRLRDEHWHVRNGSLYFDGFKGGYSLATNRDYEDFEIWADWRILSITGDSGLYLRGSPQVQIWDAHNQWNIGSGGLYNNKKNPSSALSIADAKVGDWNRFHIIMRGEKVTVWLNGVLVVDNVTLENYWDRSRPIFFKEQIELQCHGDPIEWRNIFIRELPVTKIDQERIGVCSWSWRKPLNGVATEMEDVGVRGIHLALGPFIAPDGRHGNAETESAWESVKQKVASGEWKVMSTMIGMKGEDYSTLETIRKTGGIVPDETWAANQRMVREGVRLTAELGVKYMSLHAGFLDETDAAAFDKYVARVSWMRDEAAKHGVKIILESGQETAADLASFMKRVPGIGINFDPANMILYGKGCPCEAVKILMPWICQVHVKDALPAKNAGEWGTEVPWGDGFAGGRTFITLMESLGYKGNYVVEREGGDNRASDIKCAVSRLRD